MFSFEIHSKWRANGLGVSGTVRGPNRVSWKNKPETKLELREEEEAAKEKVATRKRSSLELMIVSDVGQF